MFSLDSERADRVRRYAQWIYHKQPKRRPQYMIDMGLSYFYHWEKYDKDHNRLQYLDEMEDCFCVAEQMIRDGK